MWPRARGERRWRRAVRRVTLEGAVVTAGVECPNVLCNAPCYQHSRTHAHACSPSQQRVLAPHVAGASGCALMSPRPRKRASQRVVENSLSTFNLALLAILLLWVLWPAGLAAPPVGVVFARASIVRPSALARIAHPSERLDLAVRVELSSTIARRVLLPRSSAARWRALVSSRKPPPLGASSGSISKPRVTNASVYCESYEWDFYVYDGITLRSYYEWVRARIRSSRAEGHVAEATAAATRRLRVLRSSAGVGRYTPMQLF